MFVVLLMTAVALPCMLSASGETPKVVAVHGSELGRTVQVIGRLGRPLGTMLTVQGTWHYPDISAKDYSLRFSITRIDSESLKKPIELNVAQIEAVTRDGKKAIPSYEHRKSLEGVTWTLRAYETGRLNVTPLEYWKERGLGIPASPYWANTFQSELVGIVQ